MKKTQWDINNDRNRNVKTSKLFRVVAGTRIDKIDLDEIKRVLKKMKNNKSPGPDTIPIEFFKWLNDDALFFIAELLNQCWKNDILPTELEEANVVTLYKKGNVEDPANYRPISLLNSLYKIYASIIQTRLADTIDDRISKRQFGFRKARSTNEPLFGARRLQDYAEATAEQMFIVFLDWEKAFDKIDQEMLIAAMKRLHLPEK